MHSPKRLMCDDCGRPKSCFACKGKELAKILQSIEDPHHEECRCEECEMKANAVVAVKRYNLPGNDPADWREAAKKAREALNVPAFCQFCGADINEGHKDNCELAALIAKAEKEVQG